MGLRCSWEPPGGTAQLQNKLRASTDCAVCHDSLCDYFITCSTVITVEIRLVISGMHSSHPETPPSGLGENRLPRNQSLLPARLGTTGPDGSLGRVCRLCPPAVTGTFKFVARYGLSISYPKCVEPEVFWSSGYFGIAALHNEVSRGWDPV